MLALKIYGHLRREHSQSMAAKVTFGTNDKATDTSKLDANQGGRPRSQNT